jgi:pyridoxal phosphate enzyme (YggS family)
VTKNRGIEELRLLVAQGVTIFGENRVQEFLEKRETFPDVEWHFIGTLQANKVKYLIGNVTLIQSVDSINLAQTINDRSIKKGVNTSILLQVNLAKEPQKHGFYEEELDEAILSVSIMKNITVKGIMFIAPDITDKALLEELFSKARNIFDSLMKKTTLYDNIVIKILSMGMTNDFETAIANGSNMVRIGRALFS